MLLSALTVIAAGAQVAQAATADEWRTRSVYQIITDRFAPASDTAPARTDPLPLECDPAEQTWCGGTWLSIVDKLDYIQNMGFDAIWISPTSQNIDFQTPYNFAYHGYWVNDVTKLNPQFGSEDDLRKLVSEVHKRNMYIMVDVVVNNIPSLSNATINDPQALADMGSMWTDSADFHDFCAMDWEKAAWDNEMATKCSMGDEKLWLLDVNTESQHVITTLQTWITQFVSDYGIDGLRIDAAKHVDGVFWQGFCGAAGVFCIGEVFDDNINLCARYQTEKWMDSILGYPFYNGLSKAFGIAPKGNMSELTDRIEGTLKSFPDPSLLGNFIENHDTPRFNNITADPQLVYNAMVGQFMFDGIPILYYGQEQDMSMGLSDPYNRAALWPLGYEQVQTVDRVTRLNKIRQGLIKNDIQYNGQTYLQSQSSILANTTYDVAIRKGPILFSLTNRGSPEEPESFVINNSGWSRGQALIDLLSCHDYVIGSGGSLSISYSTPGYGGMPYVFATIADAKKLGLCSDTELGLVNTTTPVPSAAVSVNPSSSSLFAGLVVAAGAAVATAFSL